MLKAIGKYIDTMPVQKLLSQEEARADSVVIEVDRYYGAHDLERFIFVMRGITESGGETETTLAKYVKGDIIQLIWEIGPAFTKEAGTLALDLFAYYYESEADPAEDAPDYLLRYQLPSIQVRGLPDGGHVLDEQSYTAFLLKVRETAVQVIEEISSVAGPLQERLDSVENVTNYDHTTIQQVLIPEITLLKEKLQDHMKIVVLTKTQYDDLDEIEETTLYIVKSD